MGLCCRERGAYARPVTRWATFDCYGTLVDWNAGIGAELGRLFGPPESGRLLARYHVIEPRVQSEHPTWSYRDVMAAVLAELAAESGAVLPPAERDALGRASRLAVFAEVPGALAEARERGWQLAALSNTDRDLIEASLQAIGVPFEQAIVASEIGSYKPAPGHWRAFYATTGADPSPTSTSPRAISMTSCPPTTSASARSGSTASPSGPSRRRRGSCPTWPVLPTRSMSSSPEADLAAVRS